CLQLRNRFRQDLPILRLHSHRGGEFSSDLLRDFCHGEGILQSFTLPASPQQSEIAEHCIGLVMEVARTSMIHAAAPHFLWPFAGSRAFVYDTSANKLSAGAIPCVFLGFPLDVPGWQLYHPTSRRVFPSHDVTFNESARFYSLFFYRFAPLPPPPLFLAPGPPPVDPLPPQGSAPSSVSHVDPLPEGVPVEVVVDSGAARGVAFGGTEYTSWGAEPAGAEPGGVEPAGAEPGGTEPEGAEPRGAESESAKSGGAEPRGTASSGGPAGASPRLSPRPEPFSPQQLREWFSQRTHLRSGAAGAGGSAAGGIGAGGTGATSLGGVGATAGAGATRGAGALGPGGARTRGTRAAGAGGVGGAGAGDPGAGGYGAGGAGAEDTGAGGARARGAGAGGTCRRRLTWSFARFLPDSPLPAPSPYAEQTDSFTVRCEPESRPALPVCAVRCGRRVPRLRPPPVHGTHIMALRPSSIPLRVPLPPPPESSLPAILDPEYDLARAASPTVSRLLATTDPSFESTFASALIAELVDFASACRLNYATSLVAESESDCPPSIGGESDFGTDVLEDRQEDFECLAIAVPHLVARLLAPEGDPDAPDIPTPRSYAEAITVYGLHQAPREWHDPLRTTLAALGFAPSTTDPSLFLLTDTSLPPFYVLVYVDDLVFATANTKALALVNSEQQKRHTCTDLGDLRSYLGLQITRDRARRTITLTQSHMVQQVLQHFGFRYSLPQSTPLPTGHSLSAPPSDESVEPSGPYPELVGCLMYLMTCTRPDLAYPLSILARYVAPGRQRPEHWEVAKRVLR
ncbi:unnamed protein product, partial [Closterium sp. NIES-54]